MFSAKSKKDGWKEYWFRSLIVLAILTVLEVFSRVLYLNETWPRPFLFSKTFPAVLMLVFCHASVVELTVIIAQSHKPKNRLP